LLRGVNIEHVNQVWSTDITFIPMNEGLCYLVAIIDWYSRYVLSWELSNTLDNEFFIIALERALRNYKNPLIFNTDQGIL
jgi:putative transposase